MSRRTKRGEGKGKNDKKDEKGKQEKGEEGERC